MITPPQTTYYLLDALVEKGDVRSFNAVASELLGREYDVLDSGSEQYRNGMKEDWDLSTEEKVSAMLDDEWSGPEFTQWLNGEQGDMGEWNPAWFVVVAYFIREGHYPYGHYLMDIWW